MTTTSPEALAAETLAEALVAAVRCPEYTAHAEKMIGMWAREPLLGVPLREAAVELDVTVPTITVWIKRGALVETSRGRRRAVTILSLAAALAAKWTSGGSDARPLASLLDRLSDDQLLRRAREASRRADTTDLITYADDALDELLRM